MESYRCLEWVTKTVAATARRRTSIRPAIEQARCGILQHRLFTSSTTTQADRSQAAATFDSQSSMIRSILNEPEPEPENDSLSRLTNSMSNSKPKSTVDGILASYTKPSTLSSLGNIESMLDPRSSRPPPPLKLRPAPFKCGPKLGRTIHVDNARGRDIGAVFRQLNALCGRNKIRSDFMSQRYHERGGLKRKRLKSQRYRARFKTAFGEMMSRVAEMRKMGW